MIRLILLCSLIGSSLLKASSTQTEEIDEDLKGPLMMEFVRAGNSRKVNDANKKPLLSISEESSDFSSDQPRWSLDEQETQEKNSYLNEQSDGTAIAPESAHCSDKPLLNNPISSEALKLVILTLDRRIDISKQKSTYEEKLRSLNPNSDRAQLLKKLIPLFEQAALYQNKIVNHLNEDRVSNTPSSRLQALKDSIFLKNIIEINSRPNKIERLISEVEESYNVLEFYKEKHSSVICNITLLREENQDVSPALEEQQQKIEDCINSYHRLIQFKIDSAKLIKPPYEKIDDNLTNTDRARLNYLNYFNTAFHDAALEAKREQPRQEVINFLLSSAELFQKAFDRAG